MRVFLRQLIKSEKGATMVEYGIIIVLVALVAAVGLGTLGGNLRTMFQGIATSISSGSTPALPTP